MSKNAFFTCGLKPQMAAIYYALAGAVICLCHGIALAVIIHWPLCFVGILGMGIFLLAGFTCFFDMPRAVQILSIVLCYVYPAFWLVFNVLFILLLSAHGSDCFLGEELCVPAGNSNMWASFAVTLPTVLITAALAYFIHYGINKKSEEGNI